MYPKDEKPDIQIFTCFNRSCGLRASSFRNYYYLFCSKQVPWDVAQFGKALGLGPRECRFKSGHPN